MVRGRTNPAFGGAKYIDNWAVNEDTTREYIEGYIDKYCPCKNGSRMGVCYVRMHSGTTTIDLSTADISLMEYRKIIGYIKIDREEYLTAYRAN